MTSNKWIELSVALGSGVLFGLGLALSQMINPHKVIGFLDVFGHWDPTLGFVMGGGLLVTVPGFWLLKQRRQTPLLAAEFHAPATQTIDAKLLTGASLFGIGWGIAGYCPGPLVVSLVLVPQFIWPFALAMFAGWWAMDYALKRNLIP